MDPKAFQVQQDALSVAYNMDTSSRYMHVGTRHMIKQTLINVSESLRDTTAEKLAAEELQAYQTDTIDMLTLRLAQQDAVVAAVQHNDDGVRRAMAKQLAHEVEQRRLQQAEMTNKTYRADELAALRDLLEKQARHLDHAKLTSVAQTEAANRAGAEADRKLLILRKASGDATRAMHRAFADAKRARETVKAKDAAHAAAVGVHKSEMSAMSQQLASTQRARRVVDEKLRSVSELLRTTTANKTKLDGYLAFKTTTIDGLNQELANSKTVLAHVKHNNAAATREMAKQLAHEVEQRRMHEAELKKNRVRAVELASLRDVLRWQARQLVDANEASAAQTEAAERAAAEADGQISVLTKAVADSTVAIRKALADAKQATEDATERVKANDAAHATEISAHHEEMAAMSEKLEGTEELLGAAATVATVAVVGLVVGGIYSLVSGGNNDDQKKARADAVAQAPSTLPLTGSFYTLQSRHAEHLRVDLRDGCRDPCTNVAMRPANGGDNQKWRFDARTAGSSGTACKPYYALRSAVNLKMALDNPEAGEPSHAYENGERNANQAFSLVDEGGGWFSLIKKRGDVAFEVFDAPKGAMLTTAKPHGGYRQHFRFCPVADVTLWCGSTLPQTGYFYTLQPRHAEHLRVDVNGACRDAGTKVFMSSAHNGDNQQWRLDSRAGGKYALCSKINDQMALDNPEPSSPSRLWQIADNNHNQIFTLKDEGDDWFSLIKQRGDVAFDVYEAKTEPGAMLSTSKPNGGHNQHFRFCRT
jgi:hypothetical protein